MATTAIVTVDPLIRDKATSLLNQSKKALIIVLWILVLIVVVAYIFQILDGVAALRMLQTAQPSDSFKEDLGTYQYYKNVTIGSIVMSTLALLFLFVLVGAVYMYLFCQKRLFILFAPNMKSGSSQSSSASPTFVSFPRPDATPTVPKPQQTISLIG